MSSIDSMYDNFLNISTGIEEEDVSSNNERKLFFNYEPTSYHFLEKLFTLIPFEETDHLIDFGCGSGRVLFMAAQKQCKKVTGYEINDERYKMLVKNVEGYQNKFDKGTIISTFLENAQRTKIDETANKFFFFNPFELKIYINVINNILASVKNNQRNIDLYLYRPHESTIKYIDGMKVFNKTVYIGHTLMDEDGSMIEMPQFVIYSNYEAKHSFDKHSITI